MTIAKFKLYGKHPAHPKFEVQLNNDEILCNEDPILPGDSHPYNMRLFVIGHEFGAIVAVWATNEQDAFDNAVDLNMLDCFLIEGAEYQAMSEDEKDNCDCLGNAGEPFNLDYAWIMPVDFEIARDWELLKAFARCGDNNSLDY